MDKNEIIERLERLARCAVHTVGEMPFVMSLDDGMAVHEAIDILRQSQLRWIPVTERLPEKDGQYLITVKYKHVDGYEDVYTEHGEWYDGKWDMSCFGHCGEVESILAWQPLPEPYKAERREEC